MRALSASLHDYASEMQTDEPVPIEPARVISGPAGWWGMGSLAAAAALVLALWLTFSSHRNPAAPLGAADEDEEIVATLSGATGSAWQGMAPAVGAELRRGQRLQLTSGLAEITFACGAEVTLQGPATLDLNSAWSTVLHRGSLRASVPTEAIGFRVSNADVEVTDLGTEFSMVAGEHGGTDVIVLAGAVQAAGRADGKSVTLREQQARRFERTGVRDVGDREQKLKGMAAKAKVKQLARPAGYAHWAFDEADGPLARAETFGISADNLDARILSSGDGALPRIEGRRQRALALDGHTFISASAPALAGADGATVAFWVCIPEDAALPESGAMFAWHRGNAAVAQTSWNRDPAQGALGALRTETEQGYMVGTTPLRDGRWHHVAVVFGPAGRPRHYVDGRLEAVTAKRFKRPRPERAAGSPWPAEFVANTLWLGRNVLIRDSAGYFRGALDEFFLADRALTPPEIRRLLRENRPAPPPTIAAAGG